ncbi:ribonuclease 2 precursor, putative [Entamoeba invadens IP1]|uniref:Ribonuclease 2, putative n=1 Tax=Entamoeba invadens IP1 TaxID=370355 RepID=A0A0A1U8H3_ENTIV|nr:ribonuclease 2 precursor, putative [Entamoeba invadens IP1]ELP89361.1 ribonuclease 2 precursor, putative [Entamoeba invadens IP1]|eukprot:XP_004256132.1 ribonuclease 2 precursor, putative [Entamoeba invadens IP1]
MFIPKYNIMIYLLMITLSVCFGQPEKPKTPTTEPKKSIKRKLEEEKPSTSQQAAKKLLVDYPSSDESDASSSTTSTPSRKSSEERNIQVTSPLPSYIVRPFTVAISHYRMCFPKRKKIERFHYMLFSQYWLGEVCSGLICTLSHRTDKIEEGFFLHGYWPQIRKRVDYYCCENDYIVTEVERMMLDDKELERDIAKYWMSLDACRLVGYQWDKHGSCTSNIYKTPLDYLRTAINLRKKVDIWKVLQESYLKVKTNTLYFLEELKSIMERVYGTSVYFVCKNGNSVYDLRICYYPFPDAQNPQPMRCPQRIKMYETRKCNEKVMFKEFPYYLTKKELVTRNNCLY